MKTKIGYLINLLLFVSVFLIGLSGLFISEVVLKGLFKVSMLWRNVHYFASAASLILAGIHLGLHWDFVMCMAKKLPFTKLLPAKPLRIALVALTIMISVFGIYSMETSSFSRWILAPFSTRVVSFEGGGPNRGFRGDGGFLPNSGEQGKGNSVVPGGENDAGAQDGISGNMPSDGSTNIIPNTRGDNSSGAFGTPPQGFSTQGKGFGGEFGRGRGGENALSVLYTYGSIVSLFAAVAYYLEKLLKKKPQTEFSEC